MSDSDEDYEGTPENEKGEESHRDKADKDQIQINEDRALEIINVEFLTVTEWLTKEMKKLRADCNRLIDRTEFDTDEDDDS